VIPEINALQPIKFGARRETETSVPLVRRRVGPARDTADVRNGVKGGRGRQVDGAAGLAQLRKYPRVLALKFRANRRHPLLGLI
jgi:hypothetical protein